MPARPAGLGVGARLLLAFLGITGFALLAAAAAIYSFTAVGNLMDAITEKQVPSALTSLDLSRQTERIVNLAPALLSAANSGEQAAVTSRISAEVEKLHGLLDALGAGQRDRTGDAAFLALAPVVRGLGTNLESLNEVIAGRLAVRQRERALQDRLLKAHGETRKLLAPWLLIVDAEIARLRATVGDTTAPDAQRAKSGARLEAAYARFRALRRAELVASLVNDSLLQATDVEDPDQLTVMVFRLNRSFRELETLAATLDPKLRPLLMTRISEFRALATADDGIPRTQAREVQLVHDAQRLLDENANLAGQLTTAVDNLVGGARRGIARARDQARAAQSLSTNALLAIVVLAIVSSVLIVWLYVGRNIAGRLVALSQSMLSIAQGRLDSPIPHGGNDEIGRMAEALKVFRDTAVEVRETNLREIREARRRLTDAIESISEGFALFDTDDRLIVSNSRYLQLYPGLDEIVTPGVPFRDVVAAAADRGLIAVDPAAHESWLEDRVARHRDPGPPFLQRQSDGRWIQVSERRTGDGGWVAVYTDVSELKDQQAAVSRAKEAAERALEELKQTQTSLIHSEKLALLGQLAAGIAHEIKNPLNFIGNFSDVSRELLDEIREAIADRLAELDPEQRTAVDDLFAMLDGNLGKIVEHGRRADQIVKGMLSHSRGAPGERRAVAVNALVEESLNLAYHGARATDRTFNVTLDLHLDPAAGEVVCTPQDLTRVFLNLFSNAFYATRRRDRGGDDRAYRPTVTVATRDLGDTVEVRVRDNGTGIPAAVRDKIFTPFFTTKPAGEGTGLGLSLSFDIVVHKHGGTIDVDTRDGAFTEFVVRLPRRRPDDHQEDG
ncbi:MAG: PAS-domain containing protein [Hyphomicrobiales bacterium]|nr:PAS-domain containing protein [Hyphomicrobiales bacterium]MCP5372540.1 PAS-domain containing protein [Hyphomicrobiales bacterium]